MNYIVEKYAKLLDESDIKYLFKNLEQLLGSRNKAAQVCNLTRKAVYDWEEPIEQMKNETKEKVLEQSLNYLTIETLEYLSSKIVESGREVLISFLTSLYENIFSTEDKKEILKMTQKFQEIKTHYYGLLYNRYEYEIDDLTSKIDKYLKSKGLEWSFSTDRLFDIEKVKLILNTLLDSTKRNESIEELILLGFPYDLANEYKAKMQKLIDNQVPSREISVFYNNNYQWSSVSGIQSRIGIFDDPELLSKEATLKKKNEYTSEVIAYNEIA